jgi:hypothetical protein
MEEYSLFPAEPELMKTMTVCICKGHTKAQVVSDWFATTPAWVRSQDGKNKWTTIKEKEISHLLKPRHEDR